MKDNRFEIEAGVARSSLGVGPSTPTLPVLVLSRKLHRPELVFGESEAMNHASNYFTNMYCAMLNRKLTSQ